MIRFLLATHEWIAKLIRKHRKILEAFQTLNNQASMMDTNDKLYKDSTNIMLRETYKSEFHISNSKLFKGTVYIKYRLILS